MIRGPTGGLHSSEHLLYLRSFYSAFAKNIWPSPPDPYLWIWLRVNLEIIVKYFFIILRPLLFISLLDLFWGGRLGFASCAMRVSGVFIPPEWQGRGKAPQNSKSPSDASAHQTAVKVCPQQSERVKKESCLYLRKDWSEFKHFIF